MNYAERLKVAIAEKTAVGGSTKTDKTGSVGFETAPNDPFPANDGGAPPQNIAGATSLKTYRTPDDPFAGIATSDQEAEIRGHLERLLPGEDHRDFSEALAHALADPDAATACFRTSIGHSECLARVSR